MAKGIWIVKGTRVIGGVPSRSTVAKELIHAEAAQRAGQALDEGYSDIEIRFHENGEEERPARESFSERLEYDFSQN